MIYKTNLNLLLLFQPTALSKILPSTEATIKYSDADYVILHQSLSNYNEVIVVVMETTNHHKIGYMSFLHPKRFNKLTASNRNICREMINELLINTTDEDVFCVDIDNDVPLHVRNIFDSFTMNIISKHDTYTRFIISSV